MPYRRLPNTDAARIRGMKTALRKGKEVPPHQMAYSAKILVSLQKFLPFFEHDIQMQRQTFAFQNKRSGDYNEIVRKAKIYLAHFIRVMNMAISRGDLPEEARTYYGLAVNESTVPSLKTENELITWGHRIIEGEEQRLLNGGSPITNPTIALVKVRFESFLESNNYNKILIKRIHDYSGRTSELRKEADEIILQIWNEVEEALNALPEDIRRKECEDYGLVYYYRKNEPERKKLPNNRVPLSISSLSDTVSSEQLNQQI